MVISCLSLRSLRIVMDNFLVKNPEKPRIDSWYEDRKTFASCGTAIEQLPLFFCVSIYFELHFT